VAACPARIREHPPAGPGRPRPRHQVRDREVRGDLLPVKDALEQALSPENVTAETLETGAELTLKNLQSAFSRANVQEIDRWPRIRPASPPGRPDGRRATRRANTVVTVYQKGYVLNDRVLRPAMVRSSQGRRRARRIDASRGS
jgi:hypothetical protein